MQVLFILLLLLSAVEAGSKMDFNTILSLGLPLVEISTINGEEPWCDTVESPEGCMGQGITNMNKVKGRLRIFDGRDTLYDSGDYIKGVSGMTIRVRGNSSAWSWKKPFKIKLQVGTDLLTRGDEDRYGDKEWLLVKDEPISLNTVIGLKVNEIIGMQWTPAYKIVNVMMNGDYRGVYLLTESVKRNSRCRLDISETGYIFEYDPYWWNEDVYFDTPYTSAPDAKSAKFTFKYPSEDDVTSKHISYLQGFLSKLEATLVNARYISYLDLDSFVSWLLAQDILGNGDGHGSNLFMTKYDDSPRSKVKMANLWDFDAIMATPEAWSQSHYIFYFGELWDSGDRTFKRAYKKKWDAVRDNLITELSAFLNQFANSRTGEAFNRSIIYDSERWGSNAKSLQDLTDEALYWFADRRQWLNWNINGESSVRAMKTNEQPTSFYSLMGQRLRSSIKGVNIIRMSDGKVRKEMKK